jgi:twitching motility protein PilT
LVDIARRRGASDLHLEPGLPAALRIQGELVLVGEPLSAGLILAMVREAVGDGWEEFRRRGSHDSARVLGDVRCRINALHSMRGAGLAVRLLASVIPTLQTLNLHPDLARLVRHAHGLILVSGPTGCGKSSTLAALLEEINRSQTVHLVTVESPIEYEIPPKRAFIRQREVERDTPSFEQALLDSLREDPDVLMVGELRDPATMRLTLNTAETGHLVLATLHSATCAEALQRLVSAFPAEIQGSVASQLADCLRGVVCQRLTFREAEDLRVPECEILVCTSGARGAIRAQEFYKLASILELGGGDGMWTFERYRSWLDRRTEWVRPVAQPLPAAVAAEAGAVAQGASVEPPAARRGELRRPRNVGRPAPEIGAGAERVLEINAPEADVSQILSELEGRTGKK